MIEGSRADRAFLWDLAMLLRKCVGIYKGVSE